MIPGLYVLNTACVGTLPLPVPILLLHCTSETNNFYTPALPVSNAAWPRSGRTAAEARGSVYLGALCIFYVGP